MTDFRQNFIQFALDQHLLRFGQFKTKAGRLSPYFFNTGLCSDGKLISELAAFYAQAILQANIEFDILFGPAYKGIPLVAATAMALYQQGCNKPFCFNRKEIKDHGEGGNLVGASLQGRVLIIDDVISAGTSIRESISLIQQNQAVPVGVITALDRMEKGNGELSAVQEIEQTYHIPVLHIASLQDLIRFLQREPNMEQSLLEVSLYRDRYGVNNHVA